MSNYEQPFTKTLINTPTYINEEDLGVPLKVLLYDKKEFIINVEVIIKGVLCNFIDIINNRLKYSKKSNIIKFDKLAKFYYVNTIRPYILMVRVLENNKIQKVKYSLSGLLITNMVDLYDNNIIIRNYNNKKVVIEDNKHINFIEEDIKFDPIPKSYLKYKSFIANRNIGVIDIETYTTRDSDTKIYALGFRTNLEDEPTIYYINHDLDSEDLVITMINELLRLKYKNITFYCHNLGGYDIVFILKILYNYNDNNKDNSYKIQCILRDDKIIKTIITKGSNSISILDSYCMLTSSLQDLGKSFNVDTIKYVLRLRLEMTLVETQIKIFLYLSTSITD